METIVQVLMDRDEISEEEALALKAETEANLFAFLAEGDLDGAWNVMEELGLEPDYLEEFFN